MENGSEGSGYTQIKPFLSVVLPVHNEYGNIRMVFARLLRVEKRLREYIAKKGYTSRPLEVIFIDDGSTDNSYGLMRRLADIYPFVKVVRHTRRKTHAPAIYSGIAAASSPKYIAVVDADGELDPLELPDLILKAEEGYDLVNGRRYPRADSIIRRIASMLYNLLMRFMFGINLKDNICNFTVFGYDTVIRIKMQFNDQRYYMARLIKYGAVKRWTEVNVKHFRRIYGKSKYAVIEKITGGLPELLNRWYRTVIVRDPFEITCPPPPYFTEGIRINRGKAPDGTPLPEVSIVIPVKNEAENIGELLEGLKNKFTRKNDKIEIITVDDGSDDGTPEVIEKIASKTDKSFTVRLFRNRRGKSGRTVGYAIRLGLSRARGRYIITMDGDLSHTPEDALRIYGKLKEGYDLVIGGRYLKGQPPFEPYGRYKISKIFNVLTGLLHGKRITDYTSGFRGFTRDLYDMIILNSAGFEIHPELTVKLLMKSIKPIEIPIKYIRRKAGRSKLKYFKVLPGYLYRILVSELW